MFSLTPPPTALTHQEHIRLTPSFSMRLADSSPLFFTLKKISRLFAYSSEKHPRDTPHSPPNVHYTAHSASFRRGSLLAADPHPPRFAFSDSGTSTFANPGTGTALSLALRYHLCAPSHFRPP